MKKQWQGTVTIDAPVERVYEALADFSRHTEWDKFTRKVEQTKPGAADGSGAEWKVYEQLGLFSLGNNEEHTRNTIGLAKRHVRELVPNQKVTWHTHPVPNVGIGADFTYELALDAGGTKVTQNVSVNVPGVVEAVGRLILRDLDSRQQGQWQASLENLKALCEGVGVREAVAV